MLGVSDVLQKFVSNSKTIHVLDANRTAAPARDCLPGQSSFLLSPRPPLLPASLEGDTKPPKKTSGFSQQVISANYYGRDYCTL